MCAAAAEATDGDATPSARHLRAASAAHTITTHSTDAQGKPTTQTSSVTTKAGSVPIKLDAFFEDISAPVPAEFEETNHATELELCEKYQCSPALELITQAVKASVDNQWANFDASCEWPPGLAAQAETSA